RGNQSDHRPAQRQTRWILCDRGAPQARTDRAHDGERAGGSESDGALARRGGLRGFENRNLSRSARRRATRIHPAIPPRLRARRRWLRRLSRRSAERVAQQFIRSLNIATPDADRSIKFLSGGNQQKAILARWLAATPALLMLDEPTRGIDVGAKFEIAKLMEQLCRDGMGILFVSSELEEVVRSSQRVVVLRDRR